jgi:ATP-dependent Clp protease ATP-binding subunit ClpX
VELKFEQEALVEIAKKAIERETGARGLRSIMEQILRKTMFDIPSCNDIEQCIIDAEVVRGEGEIKLIKKDEIKLRQQAG